MFQFLEPTDEVYAGQFGSFTVDKGDRIGVAIYRLGLMIAALALASGTLIGLYFSDTDLVQPLLASLYGLFCLALGVSLATIHIYLAPLHRALQLFWLVGCLGSAWVAMQSSQPLVLSLYENSTHLLLGGWVFVALTGIYFKEAFCFNRVETKALVFIVPLLLGGHWLGILSPGLEQGLLIAWSLLMLTFAIRKWIQPIPPDIGDKSVFDYLHQQRQQANSVANIGN